MKIELKRAYWAHDGNGGRVYIPVIEGRKHVQCLVIEADGLHTKTLPDDRNMRLERLTERQVRGRVRKMKPQTDAARRLVKELLA